MDFDIAVELVELLGVARGDLLVTFSGARSFCLPRRRGIKSKTAFVFCENVCEICGQPCRRFIVEEDVSEDKVEGNESMEALVEID